MCYCLTARLTAQSCHDQPPFHEYFWTRFWIGFRDEKSRKGGNEIQKGNLITTCQNSLLQKEKLFRRLMCLRKKMFHIFDDAYIWQLCTVLSFRLFSFLSLSLFSYFFTRLSFSILSLFVILFFCFFVPKCFFFFHILLFTFHLHYFLKFYVLFFNWLLSFSNCVLYDISLFLAPIM